MSSQDYILLNFSKGEYNQPLESPHIEGTWSEESLLNASGHGVRDFEYTHVIFLCLDYQPKFSLFLEHKESSKSIIFHLLVKLDVFDNNDEISRGIGKLLEVVPQDHLLVFFCGTEGDCLLHQELIVNRKWNYEKKHGNMKSNKAIKSLESKFNLLVPWGDHETRSMIIYHASRQFKTYLRNRSQDKKINQMRDKLDKMNLKDTRTMYESQETRILSLRKQLDENVQKQRILQDHYEDISCDLKYEVDKHQMTEQKIKSHEQKLSVVSKQRRVEQNSKRLRTKRQSEIMKYRGIDENEFISSMENMRITNITPLEIID